MALSKLRSNSAVDMIGNESDELPSTRLPTLRQVLAVFFCKLRKKHSVRDASHDTVREIERLWDKTKIPHVKDFVAIKRLEAAYQEWRTIRRHKSDRPLSRICGMRKEKFEAKLDKLFDLSKQDWEEILEKLIVNSENESDKKMYAEEKLFFLDQQGPRLGFIAGVDIEQVQKDRDRAVREEKKIEKLLVLDERRRKDEEKRKLSNEVFDSGQAIVDSNDEGSATDSNVSPLKPKRGRRNILSPEVVEAIDAAKLSSVSATRILSAAASTSGLPVKNTNINRRSVQRLREQLRETAAKGIMESFDADEVLTLHWDGKIVPSLSGKSHQDRQAIIVTGITTNQLLGAVAVPDGTANQIVAAVVGQVEAWKVTDKIKAMSFDTTNVNTGCKNGAALGIQRALGKDLIWLPCRHHIYERVLEDVFHELMGPSTGPDVPIFRDLQNKWESIDKTKYINFKTYAASREKLGSCAESIIKFARQKIESGQPRDDYLELLELTLLFLGETPPRGVQFQPPGPMHSARWMAKAIYCIKMTLFRKQLRLSTKDLNNLLQLTMFVVKVYVKGWFSAPISVEAPSNDLAFLKELLDYENVHKGVARLAQKRFTYHLWYLNEELISLSVFDEKLGDDEREGIVKGILSRQGTEDPPRKRVIDMRDVNTLSVKDLSTTSSMTFFTILGINTSFFRVPVSQWEASSDYKASRLIATHLKVTNDHAERGVKLMSDYNRSVTKKEDSFQHLLVNVAEHRKSLPDNKKSTLVRKYDSV